MPRGGKREGAGRKSRAEELRLIETIIRSGQEVTGENDPLMMLWMETWRQAVAGSKEHMKFVYEYAYGKPKQRIEADVQGTLAPKLVFEKAE